MILSISPLVHNGISIIARESDNYVNLTLMAKANGKRLQHWMTNRDTKAFLQEIESQCLIPIKASAIKNHPDFGTWAHPKVALKFASWISKPFESMVYGWVESIMTKGYAISPIATPEQLDNAEAEAFTKLVEVAPERAEKVVERNIKTLEDLRSLNPKNPDDLAKLQGYTAEDLNSITDEFYEGDYVPIWEWYCPQKDRVMAIKDRRREQHEWDLLQVELDRRKSLVRNRIDADDRRNFNLLAARDAV